MWLGKPDGARNDITVTRVDEKVGLHASPACQLAFDDAVGELTGQPGDGLKAMFTMMNHAQLDAALQGVAHAAAPLILPRHMPMNGFRAGGADGAPVTLDETDARALGARLDQIFAGILPFLAADAVLMLDKCPSALKSSGDIPGRRTLDHAAKPDVGLIGIAIDGPTRRHRLARSADDDH